MCKTAFRVKQYCGEHSLLPSKGGMVLCAVSGGADSVCMLDILIFLSGIMKFSVTAIHYNHKLRGGESDADEQFVVDRCNLLGVDIIVGSPDVPLTSKDENTARISRYTFFAECAEKFARFGGAAVATAHNANDNAETIIMRMIRGAGGRGISGIAPSIMYNIGGMQFKVIRPLLFLSRTEIERHLSDKNIPFTTDSSNGDTCYLRNRIRKRVLPELLAINPKFPEHSLHLADSLRNDDTFLCELADRFAGESGFSPENPHIHVGAFSNLHTAVSSRVLIKCAEQLGSYLYSEHIREILALSGLPKGGWTVVLPNGLRLKRSGKLLVFYYE